MAPRFEITYERVINANGTSQYRVIASRHRLEEGAVCYRESEGQGIIGFVGYGPQDSIMPGLTAAMLSQAGHYMAEGYDLDGRFDLLQDEVQEASDAEKFEILQRIMTEIIERA